MQALWRVREKVPVLVDRAALHRHAVPDGGDGLVEPGCAVDDEELGPPQPALDEIVEHGAPGLGTLTAHALDREHHLLAVLAYADDDEERDGGRFAVEPHAHHGAVENEPHDRLFGQRAGIPRVPIALHLAPGPAHRILAHRTAKQGGERTAHPARVGASQIGARDQCVGGQRAALIARNAWLFHSVVLPSRVFSRARGTAISTGPKVPVSDRVRLPWRWPAMPVLPSLPDTWLRL